MPILKRWPRRWSCVLLLLGLLMACTSANVRPATLAARLELTRIELPGTRFTHTAYYRGTTEPQQDAAPLWIFIESDGRPWTQGGRVPALDPTTQNPLALELAGRTQHPVLYLGRPCYDRMTPDAACTSTWWTDARYSQPVIDSMVSAIRHYQERGGYSRLVLVGYSGGGTLAVLVSRHLAGVVGVITIAANLDVTAWSEHHRYLPLTTSLNPADLEPQHMWPEIHLVGANDEVVPASTTQRYFERNPGAEVWRYERFGHVCCWREEWPQIQVRLQKALGEVRANR